MFSRNMSTSINADCLSYNNTTNIKIKDLAFKEWLAGLIDGDGYFLRACALKMDIIVVK